MSQVFLSHSSRDQDIARRLAQDLRRAGFEVWFDEWAIVVGDAITQRISAGLENADFVVVLLSDYSVSSGWVEKEWQSKIGMEATRSEVVVLPVLVSRCRIPALLADKRYSDLASSYTGGLSELIAALREHTRRSVRRPTTMPLDARRPTLPATLLVVDDDGRDLEMFLRLFSDYADSLQVLTARDATEGLVRFRESLPDAMILDLMMPYGTAAEDFDADSDMDMEDTGLRLLETIRREYPGRDFWCAVATARSHRAVLGRVETLVGSRGKIYLKPYDSIQLEYDLTSALGIACRFPEELLNQLYPERRA